MHGRRAALRRPFCLFEDAVLRPPACPLAFGEATNRYAANCKTAIPRCRHLASIGPPESAVRPCMSGTLRLLSQPSVGRYLAKTKKPKTIAPHGVPGARAGRKPRPGQWCVRPNLGAQRSPAAHHPRPEGSQYRTEVVNAHNPGAPSRPERHLQQAAQNQGGAVVEH